MLQLWNKDGDFVVAIYHGDERFQLISISCPVCPFLLLQVERLSSSHPWQLDGCYIYRQEPSISPALLHGLRGQWENRFTSPRSQYSQSHILLHHSIHSVIESENFLGWKGPLKVIWSNSSAMNRNTYSSVRLLRAWSIWPWVFPGTPVSPMTASPSFYQSRYRGNNPQEIPRSWLSHLFLCKTEMYKQFKLIWLHNRQMW